MRREVIWSPVANEDFTNVLNYLNQNWNTSVAVKFIDQIEYSILAISQLPELYPVINIELGIRKCVITKHNTLFYRVLPGKIEIVRLFDTRQDPEKLGF